MSTNYYWYGGSSDSADEDGDHIGKRSGAGLYCFRCRQTLCAEGEDGIHWSRSPWHDACPKCGERFVEPGKRGPESSVRGACSWRWAQDPAQVEARCKAGDLVWDECGRVMTGQEFLERVVGDCVVVYHDSIGTCFS